MKMRPADVRIDAMASMVGSVEADSGEGGGLGEKAGQAGIGGDRGFCGAASVGLLARSQQLGVSGKSVRGHGSG